LDEPTNRSVTFLLRLFSFQLHGSNGILSFYDDVSSAISNHIKPHYWLCHGRFQPVSWLIYTGADFISLFIFLFNSTFPKEGPLELN
jgi:hypothetical protein